jgi:serine/threonine-protein kinase PRP4
LPPLLLLLLQVIRSNETMAKAAALEQRILRMLSDKDPDNRKHVIRLLRTFEYRHHVCMAFEPLVS